MAWDDIDRQSGLGNSFAHLFDNFELQPITVTAENFQNITLHTLEDYKPKEGETLRQMVKRLVDDLFLEVLGFRATEHRHAKEYGSYTEYIAAGRTGRQRMIDLRKALTGFSAEQRAKYIETETVPRTAEDWKILYGDNIKVDEEKLADDLIESGFEMEWEDPNPYKEAIEKEFGEMVVSEGENIDTIFSLLEFSQTLDQIGEALYALPIVEGVKTSYYEKFKKAITSGKTQQAAFDEIQNEFLQAAENFDLEFISRVTGKSTDELIAMYDPEGLTFNPDGSVVTAGMGGFDSKWVIYGAIAAGLVYLFKKGGLGNGPTPKPGLAGTKTKKTIGRKRPATKKPGRMQKKPIKVIDL